MALQVCVWLSTVPLKHLYIYSRIRGLHTSTSVHHQETMQWSPDPFPSQRGGVWGQDYIFQAACGKGSVEPPLLISSLQPHPLLCVKYSGTVTLYNYNIYQITLLIVNLHHKQHHCTQCIYQAPPPQTAWGRG